MKCLLCNEIVNSARQLSNHIKNIHNISSQEYYDQIYGKGYCIECGKPTKFQNLTLGYYKRCSRGCANKSNKHIESVANTKLIRYNNPGYNNPEKISKVLSSRDSNKKKLQTAKCKQTKFIKYNDANYNNQTKRMNSLITHNTLQLSTVEKKAYDMLVNKFNNVDIQYYDENRYPYFCDFYLPDLDIFIELHISWLHGFHKFDENNNIDIKRLNYLKEKSKNSNYYKKAIEVWTVSDIQKYNIAQQNNLNYKVFYTLDELSIWLDSM